MIGRLPIPALEQADAERKPQPVERREIAGIAGDDAPGARSAMVSHSVRLRCTSCQDGAHQSSKPACAGRCPRVAPISSRAKAKSRIVVTFPKFEHHSGPLNSYSSTKELASLPFSSDRDQELQVQKVSRPLIRVKARDPIHP